MLSQKHKTDCAAKQKDAVTRSDVMSVKPMIHVATLYDHTCMTNKF